MLKSQDHHRSRIWADLSTYLKDVRLWSPEQHLRSLKDSREDRNMGSVLATRDLNKSKVAQNALLREHSVLSYRCAPGQYRISQMRKQGLGITACKLGLRKATRRHHALFLLSCCLGLSTERPDTPYVIGSFSSCSR